MGSKMKEDLTVEKARMLARMHEASSSSPSRQREEKVRGGNGEGLEEESMPREMSSVI